MKLIVQKTDSLSGEIRIPGSKSHSVRALLFATLAEMQTEERAEKGWSSKITNLLDSDDTYAAKSACQALLRDDDKIFTANSGITTRFIMPVLGLRKNAEENIILDVDEQMKARPIQPLIDALQNLGMMIESANSDGTFPYRIWGALEGGETEVDGSTSQYVSALLMSLPAAKKDSILRVRNLKERTYMEMMLAWLDELGIKYEHKFELNGGEEKSCGIASKGDSLDVFHIPGRQTFKSFERQIPGDFSSASYPMAAAVLLPGEVILKGLNVGSSDKNNKNDKQGDKLIIDVLKEMGADIQIVDGGLKIRGGQPLRGIEIDADLIPDMLPTLAVLGTQAEGETKIANVLHARIKETDRVHSMIQGLRAMGADIEELEDGLIVRKSQLHGAQVHGFNDHRTIMALSLAGMLVVGEEEGGAMPAKGNCKKIKKEKETVIDTAEGINKTFPSFVELMNQLGAKMQLKQNHIVIIGFKNVGKTTIGRKLAKALGMKFVDLDEEIEKETKDLTCREILEKHGEEYFRNIETQALKNILAGETSVLALGGGAVISKENQALLSQELCVHLELEIEEVLKRIESAGWPSFLSEDEKTNDPKSALVKLWKDRKPIYEKLAKITINGGIGDKKTLESLKGQLAKHLQLNVIIGDPLEHTWTPRLHNLAYKDLDLNALMLANPCKSLSEFAKNISNYPISLTVVTMPHKQTIIKHLNLDKKADCLSEEAKAIGAVNTVINTNGKLKAYNTDVDGIAYALRNEKFVDKKGKAKKVLILGAGGAAKAAAYFVEREGGDLYCLNRNQEKAETLMQQFAGRAIAREELKNHKFSVLINATPLGMGQHTGETPLEKSELESSCTVLDMVYNPHETKLLKLAREVGCKTISGLEMFIAQGLKQIQLLTGEKLDPKIYIKKFILKKIRQ